MEKTWDTWDLRNGCPDCKKRNFEEIIDKGIVSKTIYKDGHIVEEVTTYKTDKGKVRCLNPECKFETKENDGYEL